jgi:Ca-activated chloride channel family protein
VFAGIPHLVAPLSDDYNTLKHLLYELTIDLLPVPGSRLGLALTQLRLWLQTDTPATQHVLLISDGDFTAEELTAGLVAVRDLPAQVHTLGIGTVQGDLIPLAENKWQRDAQGEVVISKLRPDYLQQLATAGQGVYQLAQFHTADSAALLRTIRASIAEQTEDRQQQKLWHERFYLPLMALMLLLLPWFRRKPSALSETSPS